MEEQFKCQFDDGGIRDVHKAMENLKLEDPNLQLADLVASVRSAMEQTREQSVVYQQMAEASKSLKQFCEMKDEIISQFRSITAPFADLVPPTPFKIPELDRSAFIEPVLAARETIRVCGLMKRARWPLMLVRNGAMDDELMEINDLVEDDDLAIAVSDIASRYLDDDWLSDTKNRWLQCDCLGSAQKKKLIDALSRHGHGDYDGCVAMLACMLSGLIDCFHKRVIARSDVDVDVFDWKAKKYNLEPLHKKDNKQRRICEKDKVIIIFINADQGIFIWESLADYVVEVVLTNQYDEKIVASNPCRNKICHGEQLNYGTWEHSAKCILVIDAILRMGTCSLSAV
ncbi:hypothetical protein [Adlercreutzia equolifaciens]|uniref:hypothetical protein n=1 Tax=Adlercreutzia equolifaciens TaxID=446660 RepID=UPI0005A13321|nr:hypothetical protein [Adlercreutzia equolifaciens]RFT84223.1 hypothetical protein DX903_03065 [Adlercreutzia equolifaciens]